MAIKSYENNDIKFPLYFSPFPALSYFCLPSAYRSPNMPEGRISKRAVDAFTCPPGKDRAFLWDDELSGFGLVAYPTGMKAYVAQYRQAGRSRRTRIGEHGRLTPDQARRQAKIILGQVEQGHDPIEARRAERQRRTLREVAADFMRDHIRAKRKPRTAKEFQRVLDRHILPALGSKRLVDIRRPEVARLHASLAAAPIVANKVLEIISAIWGIAAQNYEVAAADNPARGIVKNKARSRERFLTDEEFARLGEALRVAESVGLPWNVDETKPTAKHVPKNDRRTLADPFAVAAIRLLILTGARLREILDAQWAQVDVERGILFLPDSKTGKKPIYLNEAALAVLSKLPRLDKNPYIIPGSKDESPRADLKKPWAAVCRAANIEGVRLHDLRHTFASVGAGASLGLPIVGKLLGHTQVETTARYAHLAAHPMHRAAKLIGDHITKAMNGGKNV
jgi:integrase